MSEPELSPLAQKLVKAHDVDLTDLFGQNPDGKISARNVLEFLSLTEEEEALIERRKRRAARQQGMEIRPDPVEVFEAREASAPEVAPVAPPPAEEVEEPLPPSAVKNVKNKETDVALKQTKSQLQATAMVHQQALMQVGSLRQKTRVLDMEVERLRLKEAAARAFIQELEEKQRTLEQELENKKKKTKPLEWLRKKLF